jgi:hypothetical protein
MTKKQATPQQVAKILTNASVNVSRPLFMEIAAYALQDNSPSEVDAVRGYMPAELREFLPQKYLN